MTRLPPVPYFTVEALAAPVQQGGWGCHPDNIQAWAETGLLTLEIRPHDGEDVRVVTAAERERFELSHLPTPKDNPRKLESALFLLAAGMVLWSGEDERLMAHHYEMRDFLEGDFATKGITMLRSRESDAELIRDALKLLRESGLYRPKSRRERDAQIAEAVAIQPKTDEGGAGTSIPNKAAA